MRAQYTHRRRHRGGAVLSGGLAMLLALTTGLSLSMDTPEASASEPSTATSGTRTSNTGTSGTDTSGSPASDSPASGDPAPRTGKTDTVRPSTTNTSGDDDIYTPPSPLPDGESGDIVKSEEAEYDGAESTRVMYLSKDAHDKTIPVTGTVLVPDKPWDGPGDRPVVGYGPFTAGMGDKCAPSKNIAGEMDSGMPFDVQKFMMKPLLDKGFAIAQTDYEGLGTPGDHTYVNKFAQGHALLDMVRAAQRLEGTGLPQDGPVGLAGYSQGGGASADAAELHPDYAPELDLKGVYSGAPPSDLSVLADTLDGEYAAGFLGFSLVSLDSAYPQLGIVDELANEEGKKVFAEAKEACVGDALLKFPFKQTKDLTKDGKPVAEYVTEEPFKSVLAKLKKGNAELDAPAFVQHAPNDDIVDYGQGKQMAKDWCAKGNDVEFQDLPSPLPPLSHAYSAPGSASDGADWLADRFAGKPTNGNCGSF